jgi:hypothetical protein
MGRRLRRAVAIPRVRHTRSAGRVTVRTMRTLIPDRIDGRDWTLNTKNLVMVGQLSERLSSSFIRAVARPLFNKKRASWTIIPQKWTSSAARTNCWQQAGEPKGRDQEFYHKAEQELRNADEFLPLPKLWMTRFARRKSPRSSTANCVP